jgi:hypothetical protein
MTAKTKEVSIVRAQEVAEMMLVGAGFSGFAFDCGFRLWFTRDSVSVQGAGGNPSEIELTIESTWRIGDRASWEAKVKLLAPPDAVEPEEPVQAFALALMRWSTGSKITSASLSDDELRLNLDGGTTLVIASQSEGLAWQIGVRGVPEYEAEWLVSSADGAYYVRTP